MHIYRGYTYIIFSFFQQHVLLETEAQNVRSSIVTTLQLVKSFGEEVEEITNKMSCVIQQIEGSTVESLQVG